VLAPLSQGSRIDISFTYLYFKCNESESEVKSIVSTKESSLISTVFPSGYFHVFVVSDEDGAVR